MNKYIIFQPDSHYGYPEISKISDSLIFPLDWETLISIYQNGNPPAYTENSEYAEELDRDDFDSDEEYEEAENERKELADQEVEGIFSEYAYSDLYMNTYLISSDFGEDLDSEITRIVESIIDGEDLDISDEMITQISKEKNTDFIMTLGPAAKLAINGEVHSIGSMSGKDIMDIKGDVLKNLIINRFKNGDVLDASKIFKVVQKIDSSIKDLIKSDLSAEQYDTLLGTSKGVGLLGRLGESNIKYRFNESKNNPGSLFADANDMKTYNLGNIEIMGRDLSYRDNKVNVHTNLKGISVFNYDMAMKLANRYEENWRLPSIEEFLFLQEYYNLGILNFSNDAYWASDEIGWSNQYAYYLSTKRYGGIPKDQRLKVRLVRDI